jgi:hypothetical protein
LVLEGKLGIARCGLGRHLALCRIEISWQLACVSRYCCLENPVSCLTRRANTCYSPTNPIRSFGRIITTTQGGTQLTEAIVANAYRFRKDTARDRTLEPPSSFVNMSDEINYPSSGIVHSDLAARQFLLDSTLHVNLSDLDSLASATTMSLASKSRHITYLCQARFCEI